MSITSGSLATLLRAGQMEFSANIPAKSGDRPGRKVVEREVPFDGKAVNLYYGAAAAANNKVGVQMNYNGVKRFPVNREDEFINLADASQNFTIAFPVRESEEITVVFENQSTSPHYLNIELTVAQFECGVGEGSNR